MNQFEQNIKLDDFKAQYNSILGNIAVVNSELEIAIAARESAKIEVSNLDTEIAQKKKLLETTKAERVSVIDDTNRRILEANQATERAKNWKEDTDTYVNKELLRLENEKTASEVTVAALQDDIENLENSKDQKSQEMSRLTARIADLTTEVENLTKTVSELRTRADHLTVSVDEMELVYKTRKKDTEEEIESLIKKREEEAAKIVDYETHVKKDKEVMARRESDLLVKQRRLDQLIKKYGRH